MNRTMITLLSCASLGAWVCYGEQPAQVGGKPPQEAIERQDLTGEGSFNREGHLRREREAAEKQERLDRTVTTNKTAVTNSTECAEEAAKKGDAK